MTDQLEPYRKMVRSMRFAPVRQSIEPFYQGMQFTSEPLAHLTDSEPKKTSIHLDSAAPSSIDPAEHTAQLIHAAVTKPTVLPVTYNIPENPGDRISKLANPQAKSNAVTPPASLPPVTQTWAKISPPAPTKALPAEPQTQEAADGVSILVPEVPKSETPVAETLTQAIETGTWTEPETAHLESTESVAVEEPLLTDALETDDAAEVEETSVERDTEVLKASGESENLTAVEETVGEKILDDLLSEVNEAPEVEQVSLTEVEEMPVEAAPEVEQASLTEVEEMPAEAAPEAPEAVETEAKAPSKPLESPEPASPTLDPDTIICPSCGSMDVRKNGHQNGKQRYACKDCGRQFVETAALSPGDELPNTDKSKGGPKGFGRKVKGKGKK